MRKVRLFSVDLAAGFDKFLRFFLHSEGQSRCLVDLLLSGVLTDVLRDLHRTEMRAAHRTEVRQLRAFLRQRFVVILARDLWIERKVELVFPAKLKARLR